MLQPPSERVAASSEAARAGVNGMRMGWGILVMRVVRGWWGPASRRTKESPVGLKKIDDIAECAVVCGAAMVRRKEAG